MRRIRAAIEVGGLEAFSRDFRARQENSGESVP
jgi:hypothetical protein